MKILAVLIILVSGFRVCAEDKTHKYFTTDLPNLDVLTTKYIGKREKFGSPEDNSQYPLFIALELNSYLNYDISIKNLDQYICLKTEFDILNLLKWKILTEKKDELIEEGVECFDNISDASKKLMDKLLENEYPDAMIEYSKFLAKQHERSFNIENSLLTSALYKKPDKSVLEELMNNFNSFNKHDSEWHSSLLAARYGSYKGFSNMLKLSNDNEHLDFFVKVKEILWLKK